MPLVLDASAVAEYLVASALGDVAAVHMAEHPGDLHVPHLAAVEVTSVLRAWVRRGEMAGSRAEGALADLADLPARRWPVEPLLGRVWELRDNVTAYDAAYIALAEALDADVLSADDRLAPAVDGRSTCRVIPLRTASRDRG
jgi:predicted nucleic acid-binding protein